MIKESALRGLRPNPKHVCQSVLMNSITLSTPSDEKSCIEVEAILGSHNGNIILKICLTLISRIFVLEKITLISC